MNAFPGSRRAWLKHVFNLAWPVILSSLSVPLVGMVDTAVMGQLDEPRYMAGVAVGAVIFSSVFWAFGFLRMGTTGFVAQASGRESALELSQALWRPLLIAWGLGFVLISLQVPLGQLAFWLMGAGEAVTVSAREYFAVRIWSAPLTFTNYVILGALVGLQRMRAALMVQLLMNLTNILLDVWFVLYLGMTTAGVALASLLGEAAAALLGLWLLRQYLGVVWQNLADKAAWWRQWSALWEAAAVRALMQVNMDLFMRTLLLTAAFFFFTSQSARFGTVVLAANAILLNMLQMIAFGLDGFAHAAEALVGRACGAQNKAALRQSVISSTILAGLMALMICLLYSLLGYQIINLLTDIEAVTETAVLYLPWVILAPLVAVWSYQLDGIFVGMTRTRAMRNTMALALLIYVGLVFILVPVWGNHGLWLSLLIFLGLRGVLLGWRYLRLTLF